MKKKKKRKNNDKRNLGVGKNCFVTFYRILKQNVLISSYFNGKKQPVFIRNVSALQEWAHLWYIWWTIIFFLITGYGRQFTSGKECLSLENARRAGHSIVYCFSFLFSVYHSWQWQFRYHSPEAKGFNQSWLQLVPMAEWLQIKLTISNLQGRIYR